MASTSDIKNGLCMHYNNGIYKVVEFLHVKPGKGPAFVRTKLKSLTNGGFNFMNNETYDQIMIEEKLIDNARFMKEGATIEILYNADDDTPLTVELPQYEVFEITQTDPGAKGNTATNATKPAKIETGAEIKVPIFINEGDKVKIETATGNYVERSK